jgi:peptidylprolyl isomerase
MKDVPQIDPILNSNLKLYQEQWDEEQAVREQEEKEDRLPRVKLETTQGDVVLELFLNQAPSTVANLIRLVENGFYDGLDFYQVIDHVLALTGDPAGDGSGGSGKLIKDEHDREDSRHAFRGSLLMAKRPGKNSGEFMDNSASSQFAILLLPISSASEQQTVFGRVIEGMDVVSRLRRVDPNKEKQKGEIVLPADSIIEATVIRRPETLPEPEYVDQ